MRFEQFTSLMKTIRDNKRMTVDAATRQFTAFLRANPARNDEGQLLLWAVEMQIAQTLPEDLRAVQALLIALEDEATKAGREKKLVDRIEYEDGELPLHKAIKADKPGLVRLLLTHGANPNMHSTVVGRESPLNTAIRTASLAVIDILLETGVVDLNEPDNTGWRPLRVAIERGDPKIVELLLSRGARPIQVSDDSSVQWSGLGEAVASQNLDIVKQLLTAATKSDSTSVRLPIPLGYAACGESELIFKALLTAKPNQTELNAALIDVVRAKRPDRLRSLLEAGATPPSETTVASDPLIMAVRNDDIDSFNLLLAAGAAVINDADPTTTALIEASRKANLQMVSALIARGVPLDRTSEDGATALGLALRGGHRPIIEALVGAGVPLNISDRMGCPPLMLAIQVHSFDDDSGLALVQQLLRLGADPNQPAPVGTDAVPNPYSDQTPLHLAASYNNQAVVEALLTAGADLNPLDGNGWTPLDYLDMHPDGRSYVTLREMLTKAGARTGEELRSEAPPHP